MAEFCEKCYRKLFNPRVHLLLSTNDWLCEGCGEWKSVAEMELDEEQFEEFIYSDNNLFCEIEEQPVSSLDECFFPKTVMEKGV